MATKPRSEPKSVVGRAACDAGWRAWTTHVGVVDYGRFRKSLRPILTDTYPSPDQLAEAVQLWGCHVRSLRPSERHWQAKPEVFVSRLAEFLRMAAEPIMSDHRLTARGELLTRPEGT